MRLISSFLIEYIAVSSNIKLCILVIVIKNRGQMILDEQQKDIFRGPTTFYSNSMGRLPINNIKIIEILDTSDIFFF